MKPLPLIAALLIAALRIAGHTSEAFQAAAHLFVGGLLAAWWIKRKAGSGQHELYLAIALSIVEVACFLWFKFGAST